MTRATVTKIGDRLGVILSDEAVAALDVKEGDRLDLAKIEAILAEADDAETDAMIKSAEAIMAKRFNVLKALSK